MVAISTSLLCPFAGGSKNVFKNMSNIKIVCAFVKKMFKAIKSFKNKKNFKFNKFTKQFESNFQYVFEAIFP